MKPDYFSAPRDGVGYSPDTGTQAPQTSIGLSMTVPYMAALEEDQGSGQTPAVIDHFGRAAALVKQGQVDEALAGFDAVLEEYRIVAHEGLAAFAVRAAYNRAIVFEKLLFDRKQALQAFEETFEQFHQSQNRGVFTVAVRAGLHVARLTAVEKSYSAAVSCYSSRLPLVASAAMPVREFSSFIDHFRRITIREQESKADTHKQDD